MERDIKAQKESGRVTYDMTTFKEDVFEKIWIRRKRGFFVKVGDKVWLAIVALSSDAITIDIDGRKYQLLVQCDSNQNAYLYDLASKISEDNAVLKEGSQEIKTRSKISSFSATYTLKDLENDKSKLVKSDEAKGWTVRVDKSGPYIMIKDDSGTEHRLHLFVKKNSELTEDEKKKVEEKFKELYKKLNSNGKSLSVESFIKSFFYSTNYDNIDFTDIDKALDDALSKTINVQVSDITGSNIGLFAELGLISVKQDITPTVSSIQANFKVVTAPAIQVTDSFGNIEPVVLTAVQKKAITGKHCTISSLGTFGSTTELSFNRPKVKPTPALIAGNQVDWLCRTIISKQLQSNGTWRYNDVDDLINDLIKNGDDIDYVTIDGRRPFDVISNLFYNRFRGIVQKTNVDEIKEFVRYVFNVLKNFYDTEIPQEAINIKFDTGDGNMMGYVKLTDNTGMTYLVPMMGKHDCLITYEVNGTRHGVVIDVKTSSYNFSTKKIIERGYHQQEAVCAHLLSQRDGISLNNIRTFLMPVGVSYNDMFNDQTYYDANEFHGNVNFNNNGRAANKIDKLEDESSDYTGGLIETTYMNEDGFSTRVVAEAVELDCPFSEEVKKVSGLIGSVSQAYSSNTTSAATPKSRDDQDKADGDVIQKEEYEEEIETFKDEDSIDCSDVGDREYTFDDMAGMLRDKVAKEPQRYQAIFHRVVDAMRKSRITCRFDKEERDTSARYIHSGRQGIISFGTRLTLHCFRHECMHAMVNYYYDFPRTQRSEKINATFDALEEIYYKLRLSYVVDKDHFGISQSAIDEENASNDGQVRGMTSFAEFVAELVDPSFIQAIVTEQQKVEDATFTGRIARRFYTILGRRERKIREEKGLREDAVLNAIETIVNSAAMFSGSYSETKLMNFMDRHGDKLQTIDIDEKTDMTRTIKIKGHKAEEFGSETDALMFIRKKGETPVLARVLDYNEDGSISVCVVEDGYLEDTDTKLEISDNDTPYMIYNTKTVKSQEDMYWLRRYGSGRYIWGMWSGVKVDGKEIDVDKTLAVIGSIMTKQEWYRLKDFRKEFVLRDMSITETWEE